MRLFAVIFQHCALLMGLIHAIERKASFTFHLLRLKIFQTFTAIAVQELSSDPFVTNCQHDCPLVYLSMQLKNN